MRSPLQSLNFTALRIKDAVCDQLREKTGARPSVDTRHPDLPLTLFVGPENATLYADTSGEALFKRGWREDTGEAPLKETLAAAMLAAAGWQGRAEDGPLFDPCCGAGTIAIEAAQMACGIAAWQPAPLRLRTHAAFQAAPRGLARDAGGSQGPRAGTDSARVRRRRQLPHDRLRHAQRGACRRGARHRLQDRRRAAAPAARGRWHADDESAVWGTHRTQRPRATPPRREGFEGGGTSAEFFSKLAAHWKRDYAGWTAWLLTPDMKLPGAMRLKESRRVPLFNGAIECRMFRFDMVKGSNQPRA